MACALERAYILKGRRTCPQHLGTLRRQARRRSDSISPAAQNGQISVQDAARDGADGRPKHLGLALAVIATAQLMVVLDATIVNVALPHIQNALHFSGTNLEWVINAYTLAFGGLLLLGGRSGDLLGRRRIFIFGVLLFSRPRWPAGSPPTRPGCSTARVVQGIGGAFAAPTALSLIAVTFPEGRERNRAMGVYAAMSVAGGAVGLIVGGLLTTYASWRWVLFVNVPIGLVVALAAPRVLGESERRRGRFDLPGAITGTLGLSALVYGLSNAATSQNGAVPLGRHQGRGLAGRGGGAAGRVRVHREPQPARAGAVPGAAQPEPVRRLHHHAVRWARRCSGCSSS